VLNEDARSSTGADRHRLSATFVVAQTALALVLLVGSGLMVRSVSRLSAVDPGFRPDDTIALRISLPDARYGAAESTLTFFDDALARVRALPGVMSAGGASSLPLRNSGSSLVATIAGRPVPTKMADFPRFFYRGVTPDYFRTLGVSVVKGRDVSASDRAGLPRIAVINETAAHRYWPQGDAVGARMEPDDGGNVVEIVGVVGDTKHFGLGEETAPELFIAVSQAPPPYWRWTQRSLDLVVHTAPGVDVVPSIRAAVRELDPTLPVYLVTPMTEIVSESMAGPRHTMVLVTACASMALVLAALGMYGVIAASVRGRTREIGVRVALGAARRDILLLIVGSSVRLCLIGLALGAIAAFSLRHVIATFLVGVASTDGVTYAAVAALLIASTVIASYVPARRALGVDPVKALRSE
jgi:predicted permease